MKHKKKKSPLYVLTAHTDFGVQVKVEFKTLIAALKAASQSIKNSPKTPVTVERVR